jgi:Glycosyl transferases group 1
VVKIKIVQVEGFYPASVDNFYARFPEKARASWKEQTDALLADGFSAGHNIVPYLERLGYDPYFIIANCAYSQMAWMREQGQAIPTADTALAILRRQIDAIRPDVLYLSDALVFESNFVRSLPYRPRLVIGWHAAPLPDNHDWSAFDLILSGLTGMRKMALLLGAKASEAFMPGIPAWVPAVAADIPERHDILFAGSCNRFQHDNRNQLLAQIGEHAMGRGYDCAFHLTARLEGSPAVMRWYRPPVFGAQMIRTLRSGRIVFDSRSTMLGRAPDNVVCDLAGGETSNMRIFEATGSGAFLLTEHYDNLSQFFRIGSEIETFASREELLQKIDYFLEHPEQRRDIARRGQARCLTDHSMEKRADAFDAILRRYLA